MLAERYASIFLFKCKICNHTVVVSRLFDMRSLEVPDGTKFELQCYCGWSAEMLGALFQKHMVMPWEHEEDAAIKFDVTADDNINRKAYASFGRESSFRNQIMQEINGRDSSVRCVRRRCRRPDVDRGAPPRV
jgi:hypothetical protein